MAAPGVNASGDPLRWHVSWWRPLVLWPLFFRKTFRHEQPVPDLQVLRETHLSYTFMVVLYGTVPLLAHPTKTPSTSPLVLAGIMVPATLVLARWLSRKHPFPPGASPATLAGHYRTRYVTEGLLATTPAAWGMVNTLVTGWRWPCLLGAAISLVWLWLVGPASVNIRRVERRLRAKDPAASLVEGLTAEPSGP